MLQITESFVMPLDLSYSVLYFGPLKIQRILAVEMSLALVVMVACFGHSLSLADFAFEGPVVVLAAEHFAVAEFAEIVAANLVVVVVVVVAV